MRKIDNNEYQPSAVGKGLDKCFKQFNADFVAMMPLFGTPAEKRAIDDFTFRYLGELETITAFVAEKFDIDTFGSNDDRWGECFTSVIECFQSYRLSGVVPSVYLTRAAHWRLVDKVRAEQPFTRTQGIVMKKIVAAEQALIHITMKQEPTDEMIYDYMIENGLADGHGKKYLWDTIVHRKSHVPLQASVVMSARTEEGDLEVDFEDTQAIDMNRDGLEEDEAHLETQCDCYWPSAIASLMSENEYHALHLKLRGKTQVEIAEELGVTVKLVSKLQGSAREKLGDRVDCECGRYSGKDQLKMKRRRRNRKNG